RAGLARADGSLFTSGELARPWREAGLIGPRQPVYPVLEASTPLRPPDPGAPVPPLSGDPALLWVGRLHPVKDPLTVLEGLAGALADLPGAALSMAFGSAELLGAVRERAARPDLAGRVALLGRLPPAELPAYYAAADLFVLGSRREGSGYALIEALACGLPPAVTDIPAFRAVTGGAVGALWPPGDAAACAEALVRVARGDRASQRAAARARFAEALSWESVGRAALGAYADTVRRRCASP
ncbi:MAG TPA: glycosyltransferase family 4 protein, partial [Chloroflexaceae bacterium]|nr:glycosyltransferase family 4 protein [Chloroflexaceae bacterium]